ncbi:hypothetical protein PENTCL1PPCAC_5852, partial [Pristionchus entomophagus]
KKILLFSLVAISILVSSIILHNSSSSTCTSISCVRAGEILRRKSAAAVFSIDTNQSNSISPCDDFYEFACAGWAENTIVRAPRSREWNVPLETSFKSFDRIKKLFARLMSHQEKRKAMTPYQTAALITYQKCMMESTEDANSALKSAYQEMKGWLSTASDERTIEETLIGAYRSNAVSLFHINAQIDAKDIQKRTILTIEEAVPYVSVQSLYGTMDGFTSEDLISGQLDGHWLHGILFSAGLELGKKLDMMDSAQFKESLAKAIQLDYKITRCSPHFSITNGESPEQYRTTLGYLTAKFGHVFDFRFFLDNFIGREINANTEIMIAPGMEYFNRLMSVLQEYSTMDGGMNVIKDYIKFKQLFMLTIHSGKLEQRKQLGGLETLRILYTGEDDRSLQCINRVGMINQLGFTSLLEKFMAPQLQENMEYARNIGESMRREYIDVLRKSDVIDGVDRTALIDKAERIRIRIAVPEASRDPKALLEESNMFVSDDLPWATFFTTTMGNRHWKQFSDFGKPSNPAEWPTDTNPFNINVHYNYESNSILFPIIWTMEQFLDAKLPSLFSFAGF